LSLNFTFHPYCNPTLLPFDHEHCGDKKGNILGSAYPASFHAWYAGAARSLGVDESYMYPRALARQYNISYVEERDPGGFDIVAALNSDANWWFSEGQDDHLGDGQVHSGPWKPKFVSSPSTNSTTKNSKTDSEGSKRNVYDFEQIAMHEILHGLGVISSWGTLIGEEGMVPFAMDLDSLGNVTLGKPYIFNKWLADSTTGVWLKDYEAQMAKDASSI
ncbi:hypothetical protein HK097_006832, partial [Rhizophlyctis rosea]